MEGLLSTGPIPSSLYLCYNLYALKGLVVSHMHDICMNESTLLFLSPLFMQYFEA